MYFMFKQIIIAFIPREEREAKNQQSPIVAWLISCILLIDSMISFKTTDDVNFDKIYESFPCTVHNKLWIPRDSPVQSFISEEPEVKFVKEGTQLFERL